MAKKRKRKKQLWAVSDERGEITRGRIGRRPPVRGRRGGVQLGASDDAHLRQAQMSLTRAVLAQRQVLKASRGPATTGRCNKVWDGLLVAFSNESHAAAHLLSLHLNATSKREWGVYHRIQKRNHQLRDTLGFQCTRRVGGIR